MTCKSRRFCQWISTCVLSFHNGYEAYNWFQPTFGDTFITAAAVHPLGSCYLSTCPVRGTWLHKKKSWGVKLGDIEGQVTRPGKRAERRNLSHGLRNHQIWRPVTFSCGLTFNGPSMDVQGRRRTRTDNYCSCDNCKFRDWLKLVVD